MNWRLQNPKGFRENIYTKHELDQNIIVREGIRVWKSIIRESADFTLLNIGNPGALVTFFNYIPGLLFPKKIMQCKCSSLAQPRIIEL